MIFAADLDRTLVFSAHSRSPDVPVVAAEYRNEEPYGFMTHTALCALRALQKRTTFFVNTLRGEEQARRVVFVENEGCPYLACQNGLYLYRAGVLDTAWAAHVARTVASLSQSLDAGIAQISHSLPGIDCLSKRYEYLAVFFTHAHEFDNTACANLALELADAGWELHRQGKKLYLSPLSIDKGAVLRRVRELEDGDSAVGFGDSYFDLPMLAACNEAYSLAASELYGQTHQFHIHFSTHSTQAGTEEILSALQLATNNNRRII